MTPAKDAQRELFRRWPAGVSVVVAEAGGRRGGMTVSSLVSLSLESRLVGISIAHEASLHRILDQAPDWAVSILGGDQRPVAEHFARSLEPDELWAGIEVDPHDPRLLAGAEGWLVARTVDRVIAGDHTFLVGEVVSCKQGSSGSSLVYVHRGYLAV